jgi:hypothetical protein
VGYATAMWFSFGEALAAVSGALTGLLFVAHSLPASPALTATRPIRPKPTTAMLGIRPSCALGIRVAHRNRHLIGSLEADVPRADVRRAKYANKPFFLTVRI